MPPLGDLIARLSALHPKTIDLNLERVDRLLQRLDHPERRLPGVIHVAGTNGKGSTIAYLRAILEAAGRRVHVLTSPYLARLCRLLTKSPALETASKPVAQVTEPTQIVSAPEAVPAAPHA